MYYSIIIPVNNVTTEWVVCPHWNTTDLILFSMLLTTRLLEGMQLDDNLNFYFKILSLAHMAAEKGLEI